MFLTSLEQICNEYLIMFSENQSAPQFENRKTSRYSPCARNLLHLLVSWKPGYHNLCSPDHYTRHPSNYTNWGSFGGEESNYSPPGSCIWGEALNASEIAGKTHHGGGGKWTINADCNGFGGMCTMCEKLTQPILRLRGLCEDSQISDLFIPVNDEKGTLGYHNVLIQ